MLMWIILSSVFIAVFLLIRALFSKKINAVSMYVLWMLVAVRLLIPTYIPVEFNLFAAQNIPSITHQVESVEDSVSDFFTAQESTDKTEIDTLIPAAPADTTVHDGTENQDTTVQTNHGTANVVTEPNVVVEPNVQTSNLTKHPFLFIWIIGILGFGCYFIITNIRFSMRLKRSRIPLNDYECKLPVYLVKWLPAPCMTGLIQPAIYVNEQIYDIENPHYVIEHEYMHYRHKDMVWMLIQNILLCIHWFNPLIWIASYLFRKDCEYACDEAVAKQLNAEERIAYGRTLLFFEVSKTKPFVFSTATSMSMDKKTMKRRVHLIVDQVPKRILSVCVAVIIAVVLFAGSLVSNTSQEPIDSVTDGTYWNETYALEDTTLYYCFYPDGTLEHLLTGRYALKEKNGEKLLVLAYDTISVINGKQSASSYDNILILNELDDECIQISSTDHYFTEDIMISDGYNYYEWTDELQCVEGTNGLSAGYHNFYGVYHETTIDNDNVRGYRFNLDGTFEKFVIHQYEVLNNHELKIDNVTWQYHIKEDGALLSTWIKGRDDIGTRNFVKIGVPQAVESMIRIEQTELTKDLYTTNELLNAAATIVSEFQNSDSFKGCTLQEIRFVEDQTYDYYSVGKQYVCFEIDFQADNPANPGLGKGQTYTYNCQLYPSQFKLHEWIIDSLGQG